MLILLEEFPLRDGNHRERERDFYEGVMKTIRNFIALMLIGVVLVLGLNNAKCFLALIEVNE